MSATQYGKLWTLLERMQIIDKETIQKHLTHHLEYTVGRYKFNTTGADIYQALAFTIRDILIDRWNAEQEVYVTRKPKQIYYLSMEFLLGRLLVTNLVNLRIYDKVTEAISELGYSLDQISQYEPDAALGNGGLGRLAACFMDSLSTLGYPAMGAGLRYEYGIFNQRIVNGEQQEAPDNWLARGNPWEIMRSDRLYPIQFYGYTEHYVTTAGDKAIRWVPGETVMAMAHDLLIPGYASNVNNLRLWAARATDEFNFDYFNHGDYFRAVEDKQRSENISRVLYPNENILQGKELRLKQEYLLSSATLQDALKSFRNEESDWDRLPDRVFFQLNDTHPAVSVAELMRLLVDDHGLDWDYSWNLTVQVIGYTNHTVLPEALEKWDIELFGNLLPRHLEIIYQINHLFLQDLRGKGLSEDVINRLSIIEEFPSKKLRMANLAIVGSKAVNGVAALHTDLIRKEIFKDFYDLWPDKIQNKTNGITHRRWMVAANRDLTALINEKIGTDWISDLARIEEIENFSEDEEFQNRWHEIKILNKKKLANIIRFESGVNVDPESIFDVQVKRIHEYKRQHLAVLHLIAEYQRMKTEGPFPGQMPRTVIFAGKAAPGYYMAKLIIRLIHSIASVINNDKEISPYLKVVFLPNFTVSLAERIFPASDLSEQISKAGMEASGTGNMKFMLNGALTIGTLDGANVEILEAVGEENIYIFGNTVDQIRSMSNYDPVFLYESDPTINHVLNALHGGYFNQNDPGLFQDIFHNLTYGGDYYFLLADFHDYLSKQHQVLKDYTDRKNWLKRSILNTAKCGIFSSDRTIRQYADEIWNIEPVEIRELRKDC